MPINDLMNSPIYFITSYPNAILSFRKDPGIYCDVQIVGSVSSASGAIVYQQTNSPNLTNLDEVPTAVSDYLFYRRSTSDTTFSEWSLTPQSSTGTGDVLANNSNLTDTHKQLKSLAVSGVLALDTTATATITGPTFTTTNTPTLLATDPKLPITVTGTQVNFDTGQLVSRRRYDGIPSNLQASGSLKALTGTADFTFTELDSTLNLSTNTLIRGGGSNLQNTQSLKSLAVSGALSLTPSTDTMTITGPTFTTINTPTLTSADPKLPITITAGQVTIDTGQLVTRLRSDGTSSNLQSSGSLKSFFAATADFTLSEYSSNVYLSTNVLVKAGTSNLHTNRSLKSVAVFGPLTTTGSNDSTLNIRAPTVLTNDEPIGGSVSNVICRALGMVQTTLKNIVAGPGMMVTSTDTELTINTRKTFVTLTGSSHQAMVDAEGDIFVTPGVISASEYTLILNIRQNHICKVIVGKAPVVKPLVIRFWNGETEPVGEDDASVLNLGTSGLVGFDTVEYANYKHFVWSISPTMRCLTVNFSIITESSGKIAVHTY
jgi:hypothetical protein